MLKPLDFAKLPTYHCPFKLNFSLHILGQRQDGYHLIESLTVFVPGPDSLAILPLANHEKDKFTASFATKEGLTKNFYQHNLVIKALKLLRQTINKPLPPLWLHLHKELPIASGIGGGSGNAAMALYMLNEFWQLKLGKTTLLNLAAKLGADIPACLYYLYEKNPVFMTGIGEKLTAIKKFPTCYGIIANNKKPLSTNIVFEKLQKKYNPPLGTNFSFESREQLLIYLKKSRNDLWPAALKIQPEIIEVITQLKHTQPIFARMSGSGGTCFALYKNVQNMLQAKNSLLKNNPHWFIASFETNRPSAL